MKTKYRLAFALSTLLVAQMSQASEWIIPERKESSEKVYYKSYVYDPYTFTFEGDLFTCAEHMAGQLGACYLGMVQGINKQLSAEHDKLSELQRLFDSDAKEEFERLKEEKRLSKKGSSIPDASSAQFNEQKFSRYNELKETLCNLLVQESIVKKIELKKNKYDQGFKCVNSIPTILQNIFYLITLNPGNVIISKETYCENGYTKFSKTISTCHFGDYYLPKEGMKVINKKELKEDASWVFDLLSNYEHEWLFKDQQLGSYGGTYLKFQEILKRKEIKLLLPWLITQDQEPQQKLEELVRRVLAKEIKDCERKMREEIQPLAEFHNRIIVEIKNFKQEIAEGSKG